jgi:glucose/mannose-6-phosphate isomerase
MGGSAIDAEIAAAALRGIGPVPVIVSRGYDVPAWCGPSTVAIATSYSGNTEETLAAAEDARSRGARLACVASGGRLAALADAWRAPLALVPAGYPPRAAIGHLAISTLLLLERACLSPVWGPAIEEARAVLRARRSAWRLEEGPVDGEPASVASALDGTMTFVYHGGGETGPVALRWRGQLAENAKTLAHAASFPEANHNEIVGGEGMEEGARVSIVALETPADGERVRRGMEAALRLVAPRSSRVIRAACTGSCPLARIFSGVYFADWVSYFLALRRGVDPTPVRSIEALKRELAEERR